MSKVIYKFSLPLEAAQHVAMPRGASILTVGVQEGEPVLWAECDDQGEYVGRRITIGATGGTVPEGIYVGTFTVELPSPTPPPTSYLPRFVGHVYDDGEWLTITERLPA